MSKTFLILIISLVLASSCYGAPCYGTKMPFKGYFFMGGQTHLIFERHLEDAYGEMRSTQHFLLISYGITDWFVLDLKGGAGNIKQHPVGSDELDYPSSFTGGYGFRIKLYEDEKFKVVYGFQHISVHPRSIRINNQKNTAVLDDWQTSLLVSYDFDKFNPYLGLKASRTDYIHWIEDNRKRKMSDLTEVPGLVVGCDFHLNDTTWLNLEGQLFDIEAFAFSINIAL
ncbi:MAG: hypothetical protein JSW17_05425 [Candidatus Omnitrophota bacterium]|nr:MAG: hypothetical protein JSW17_05425 [Candidatus Omnitrophota bacterium]